MSIIFTMKTVLVSFCLYLILSNFLAEAATTVAPIKEESSDEFIIHNIHEIGREISYAQWDKHSPPEDVILSPLSIGVILNLLLLGTNGTSNLEIRQALNYPDDLQEHVVHETYEKILTTQPQSGNDFEISLLTRIFVQIGVTVLDSFKDVSNEYYQAEVESLDFKNSPDASTERINSWVSQSSKGKIEELYSEPLSSDVVSVLANVVFLNATWVNKFDPKSTKDGYFYTGTETIPIPVMNKEMYVLYRRFESEGFEMISLPYVGDQYSMYILKPKENGALQEIERSLNASYINNFISQLVSQNVDVTIPKMKLSLELELEEDLKSFGINEVFSPGADFSRFTNDSSMYISSVVHKAILEVREEGTVASAATAAQGGLGSSFSALRTSSEIFKLDAPSLIFIRDNSKKLTLFYGRVMKPQPLQD